MIIKNKLYFCKIFSVSISVSIVSSLGLKSLISCTLRSPNIFYFFNTYIYPPDSQESDPGANTKGKQLPRPASENAKILLSACNLMDMYIFQLYLVSLSFTLFIHGYILFLCILVKVLMPRRTYKHYQAHLIGWKNYSIFFDSYLIKTNK